MTINEKYLKIILGIIVIGLISGILLYPLLSSPEGRATLKDTYIVYKWLKNCMNQILVKFFDTTINKILIKGLVKNKIIPLLKFFINII